MVPHSKNQIPGQLRPRVIDSDTIPNVCFAFPSLSISLATFSVSLFLLWVLRTNSPRRDLSTNSRFSTSISRANSPIADWTALFFFSILLSIFVYPFTTSLSPITLDPSDLGSLALYSHHSRYSQCTLHSGEMCRYSTGMSVSIGLLVSSFTFSTITLVWSLDPSVQQPRLASSFRFNTPEPSSTRHVCEGSVGPLSVLCRFCPQVVHLMHRPDLVPYLCVHLYRGARYIPSTALSLQTPAINVLRSRVKLHTIATWL